MRHVLVAICCAGLGACASVGTYSSVDLPDTMEVYDAGVPIAVSERSQSAVVMAPDGATQDASDRPIFAIFVQNTGKSAFDIGPESVAARTGDGRALAVIPPSQLEREARRAAAWTEFGTEFAAGFNDARAANAGHEYGTATYQGTTTYQGTATAYGTGGYATATGTGTATSRGTATYSGYNAAAGAQARAAADAKNAALRADAAAQIAAFHAEAEYASFHRQSLPPGYEYLSRFTLETLPSNARRLEITVSLGADTHVFAWDYSVN
jgi:hypothetical protein